MGFFDFFKKKQEPEIEKLEFKDIENWINETKQQNKSEEEKFFREVKNFVSDLIKEIENQIPVLEKIDLSQKKEQEKIKLITKQNLDNYIFHLKVLIKNLKDIDNADFLNKISHTIFDFNEKSNMSFEKATFLIGKELGKVREFISNFLKDLNKLKKENTTLIKNSEIISIIEIKLKDFDKIKGLEDEINKNIKTFEKQINNLSNKNNILFEEIEKIKNSPEYVEELKKQNQIKLSKINLDEYLNNLKQSIDFKTLANTFHSNESEMSIIKEHKDNFKPAYEKNNGSDLLSLFEFNKNKSEIENKIKEINKLLKKIEDSENALELKNSSEIVMKNTEIEKNNHKIEELNQEISKESKKFEKIKDNQDQIKDLIKQELIKINIELVL